MASRRYLNFDLLLEQEGEGRYQARVTDSPLDETPSVRFQLPFDATTLENLLLKLDPGRSGTRRVGATGQQQAAMDFGGPLYEAVFSGDLAVAWQRSLDRARSEDASGLRLRLRLKDAPAIAGLPWELLYDRRSNSFLAQSERTPVVRFLDVPHEPRPMTVDGPLRLLAIISSPIDLEELDVEAEWRRLQKSLSSRIDAGLVVLDRLPAATLGDLGDWLRTHQTHVIHFVGHGDFDARLREGVVYFQDEHGRSSPITSSILGPFVRDHDALRMVVLNACRSARSDAVDPFAGMAQGLVQQDATAVVAMQFPISDRAAVTFTGEFYGALVEGLPVDQAVSSARKALLAEFRDEWSTPVLFMRSPDGNIFENVHAAGDVVPTGGPHSQDDDTPPKPGPSLWKSLVLLVNRNRRLAVGAAAAVAVLVVGLVAVVVVRSLDDADGTPDGNPTHEPADDLPHSAPLAPSQLLVGAGRDEGAVRIWRVDVTGATPPQQLNSGRSVERLPVLGPDRDTVVYQRQRTGNTYDLWAAQAQDGDGAVELFDQVPEDCQGSNGRPAWVPGTTEYILRCVSRGTLESRTLSLLQLDRSGDETASYSVKVGGETFDGIGDPTVSPDGSTLVVYAADDRDDLQGSLFAIDISSGISTLLLPAEGDLTYSDPVFSPVDNRLAWRVARPEELGGWEVETAILSNGELGPIESLSEGRLGDDRDPTFSPDGTQVVFAHANGDGSHQLYLADVSDTPDAHALTFPGLPRFLAVPTWTRR